MTEGLLAAGSVAFAVAAFGFLPALHPAQLWTAPWAASTTLLALGLLPYRALSTTTAVLICGATAAFIAGSLAGERLGRRLPWGQQPLSEPVLRHAAIAAMALTALMFAAFVIQGVVQFGVRSFAVPSPEVRHGIQAGQFAMTVKYVYAAFAATVLASAAAGRCAAGDPRRRVLLLAAGGCAATTFWSTGRATLLSAAVVGAVAFLIAAYPTLSSRRVAMGLAAIAALAVAVLSLGGAIIGKTFENNVDLNSVPSTFTAHAVWEPGALPYQYATAPIAALDVQVRATDTFGDTSGCALLTIVCGGLKPLGIPVEPVDRIRPFTRKPLRWNTYTALDLPLLDGGIALAIPLIGIIGVFCGYLWLQSSRASSLGVAGYPIAAGALTLSSGANNFLAPHFLGAVLIALGLLLFASRRHARLRTG